MQKATVSGAGPWGHNDGPRYLLLRDQVFRQPTKQGAEKVMV